MSTTEELNIARDLYNKSPFEEEACKKQIEFTVSSELPILKGYHATAMIVGTKYISNPFKRVGPFKEGKNILEELISENFDEVELRFMRYTIQRQAPRVLGYYRNLDMDKDAIVNYIKDNPSSELTKHMMVYLKDTKDEVLTIIS